MTIGLWITAAGFVIWLRYIIPGFYVLWGSRNLKKESQQILKLMRANINEMSPSADYQDHLDSMVDFNVLRLQHDELMERWRLRNDESDSYITKQLYGIGVMWLGIIITTINEATS